jgi:hypothetical protein
MANVAAAFPLKWLKKDTDASKDEFIPSPEVLRSAWRTDTQITGKQDSLKERELQRWMPDEVTDTLEELSTDPQARMKGSGQWDQFEANAELFGMESTFKEDLSQYTTQLDLTKVPLSVQRKAERLAAEIERKGGSANRDFDNGNELDDDGDVEDEEERWSAVPRATVKQETVTAQQVPSTAQTKVPGAYFHIDGIGLVDEQVARATPWMLAGASERIATQQQQHHPSQQYHAEERYCNQATCYAGPVQFCAWATPAAADATRLEQMPQHSAPLSTVPQQPTVAAAAANFATGAAVMVTGLTKLPAFNGRVGEVQSFDAESGRYNVLIELQQDGGEARQLAKIRGQHLVALPSRPPLQ